MLKVPPHPDYPPEEGRYLRGNDYSPAAVVIILTTDAKEIPSEIERLVRTGNGKNGKLRFADETAGQAHKGYLLSGEPGPPPYCLPLNTG